jgi:hypothetical protein
MKRKPAGCLEISGTKHPATQRYVPEERSTQLARSQSVQNSHKFVPFNINFMDREKEYCRTYSNSQLMKHSSMLKQSG